jgi:hypothetical protein
MESGAEAVEQRDLGSIAKRASSGVRTQRQLEAHDRAAGRDEVDRRTVQSAELETANLGVGYADGTADRAETESLLNSRFTMIGSGSRQRVSSHPTATIGGSLSRSHVGGTMAAGAYLAIIWPSAP